MAATQQLPNIMESNPSKPTSKASNPYAAACSAQVRTTSSDLKTSCRTIIATYITCLTSNMYNFMHISSFQRSTYHWKAEIKIYTTKLLL